MKDTHLIGERSRRENLRNFHSVRTKRPAKQYSSRRARASVKAEIDDLINPAHEYNHKFLTRAFVYSSGDVITW